MNLFFRKGSPWLSLNSFSLYCRVTDVMTMTQIYQIYYKLDYRLYTQDTRYVYLFFFNRDVHTYMYDLYIIYIILYILLIILLYYIIIISIHTQSTCLKSFVYAWLWCLAVHSCMDCGRPFWLGFISEWVIDGSLVQAGIDGMSQVYNVAVHFARWLFRQVSPTARCCDTSTVQNNWNSEIR